MQLATAQRYEEEVKRDMNRRRKVSRVSWWSCLQERFEERKERSCSARAPRSFHRWGTRDEISLGGCARMRGGMGSKRIGQSKREQIQLGLRRSACGLSSRQQRGQVGELCVGYTPCEAVVHVGGGVTMACTSSWGGPCWVRNRPRFLMLKKAKQHDRVTEATWWGKDDAVLCSFI